MNYELESMFLFQYKIIIPLVLLLMFFAITPKVNSAEFSSADFTVRDPILVPSGYSSSSDFQLQGNISQIAVGTSSSASFGNTAGFLPFIVPSVTPPVIPPPTLVGGGGILGLITEFFIKPKVIVKKYFCDPDNPSDINCDGVVNFRDLSIFLYLEPIKTPTEADFNKDEKIDIHDLSILFSNWTERIFSFRDDTKGERTGITQGEQKILDEYLEEEQIAALGVFAQPSFSERFEISEEDVVPEIDEEPRIIIFEYTLDLFSNAFKKVTDFFFRR